MDLRQGSQAAVGRVVDFLATNTVSANGDVHVGSLIAQAMEKVGKEGVITVKEGRTIEDETEITEGCGLIWVHQPIRVKSQKVEFEKPFILPNEKKISPLQDILPSLEAAAHARRPLVIIAEGVDGEALAACILNKLRGQHLLRLRGLAILTGGTVFTDELDIKPERANTDLLGLTGSITITKDNCSQR
jgi:chaperonin GroEL